MSGIGAHAERDASPPPSKPLLDTAAIVHTEVTPCPLQAKAGLPSASYLSLLRQGAEQHRLQADYCEHLGNLQTYEADTWGKQMGAKVMRTFFAPLLSMMVHDIDPAVQSHQRLFLAVCSTGNAIIDSVWLLHDWLLAPILGSGC